MRKIIKLYIATNKTLRYNLQNYKLLFRVIYLSVSYKTGTGQTSWFSSTKLAFVTVCRKIEYQNIKFECK